MSNYGTRYLVDTNVLSQLGRLRRASEFFRTHVRIPSEVLNEAHGFPDIAVLRQLEYPTTLSVLERLKGVMASVPSDDTDLVDLYSNRGGADPLMVACALDARDLEMHHLDPHDWITVSDDKAVRAKSLEFKVGILSFAQFATLIDHSGPKEGTSESLNS